MQHTSLDPVLKGDPRELILAASSSCFRNFYVLARALRRGCFTTRRTFHMPVTVRATSRHSMPTDYLSTVTCSISQDTHIRGQRTGEPRGGPSSESRRDCNACHSSSMAPCVEINRPLDNNPVESGEFVWNSRCYMSGVYNVTSSIYSRGRNLNMQSTREVAFLHFSVILGARLNLYSAN